MKVRDVVSLAIGALLGSGRRQLQCVAEKPKQQFLISNTAAPQ